MPKATAASIGKKRSLSDVDRVHACMGLTLICDKEQISKDLGERFVRTIGTLATNAEIESTASGFYCLPSITDGDPRVVLLMAPNNVYTTSPKIIKNNREKPQQKKK